MAMTREEIEAPKRTARLENGFLIIRIGEESTSYELFDLSPDDPQERAIRLIKANGECHDLYQRGGETDCTCGAFTWRNPKREKCKHVLSLIAVGVFKKQ